MRAFWRTYRPLQLTPLTWTLFAVQTIVFGTELGRVLRDGTSAADTFGALWPLTVPLTYLGMAAGIQLTLLVCGPVLWRNWTLYGDPLSREDQLELESRIGSIHADPVEEDIETKPAQG